MRWLGAARGPVAAAFGPGPWDAFGVGLAHLGYRLLVVQDGAELDRAMAEEGMPDEATPIGAGSGAREATAWALANPHRLRRLVLIAPEGILHPPAPVAPRSWPARLPLIGPWLATGAPMSPRPPLMEAEHRALAAAKAPVIALWAGADETVPLRALGDLAHWNRGAKHEVIEGAGHDLLAQHPERVVETLRDVLREDFSG